MDGVVRIFQSLSDRWLWITNQHFAYLAVSPNAGFAFYQESRSSSSNSSVYRLTLEADRCTTARSTPLARAGLEFSPKLYRVCSSYHQNSDAARRIHLHGQRHAAVLYMYSCLCGTRSGIITASRWYYRPAPHETGAGRQSRKWKALCVIIVG